MLTFQNLQYWKHKICHCLSHWSSYAFTPISELHRHALSLPSSSSYHFIQHRYNCFWPSLTFFVQLTLLDLPKDNLDTEPSYEYTSICEYFAFGYPQLSRRMIRIPNVFSSQFHNLTLHKITCNWHSRSTTGHISLEQTWTIKLAICSHAVENHQFELYKSIQ